MEELQKNPEGKLQVSIDEEFKGLKHVDLFADYSHTEESKKIVPYTMNTITDSVHLRRLLTPVTCPACQSQQARYSYTGYLKERFLKIAGRRFLYCSNCNTRQIVKVHTWEWEIVSAALAMLFILLITFIHWIKR